MEQEKILILNLLDDFTSELSAALGADSLEVVSTIDDLGERSPFYILVNSVEDVPENELLKDSRVLCFDHVSDVSSFLQNQGDLIFNPTFAKSDIGEMMLSRFFSRETVVQMESAYEGILKKSFSTKFSNPLTVGYYSDIITKFAHTEKTDLVGLRTFLSSAASFFTYLTKEKVSWFPLDVDYGVTKDALVVQMTAPVTKIYKDYIIQALSGDNPSNPFVSLMDICTKQSHAIDLYYLEKSNKLVITGVWLKDQSLIGQDFYPSLLINHLYTFEEQKNVRKNSLTSKVKVAQEEVVVNYDNIPGAGIDKFEEDSFEDNKNLLNIKKLVDFIRKYREDERDKKSDEELALRDISRYLRKYPDQIEIRNLEQNDREAILKCFCKKGVQEELEETLTVVKSSINQEEFLQTVLDNLTEMDKEDAINIISGGDKEKEQVTNVGGSEEEKEVVNKITGSEEEKEVVNKITGSEEEKEDKNKVTIKGGESEAPGSMKLKRLEGDEKDEILSKEGGDINLGNVREAMRKKHGKDSNGELDLGDWESKKKKIASEVTKKLELIRNSDGESNLENLEDDIMTVFKNEMGEDEMASSVVKSITANASDKLIAEKLNSVHESKLKIEKEKGEQALSLRDEQLGRMKKILDVIKEENGDLKSKLSDAITSSHDDGESAGPQSLTETAELKTLENQLKTAVKEKDIKDIAIEKLKENQNTAIVNKDKQIEQIQQRLDAVLDSHSKGGEEDIATELKKVSNENRLLQSQLDLKDKNIDNMNKRMDDRSNEASNRSNVELERVKDQNRVALEAMKAFKIEKSQLEGKLRESQRESRQKETELNIEKAKATISNPDTSKEVREKDRELQASKIEINRMSEQNKALVIRAKQLEQKMKFLNAQVESSNKGGRNPRAAKGPNAPGGREAKLALKLKQADTAREKMAMDTQRLSGQLDAKKKEAVALTTENNTIKNKLHELEQKLAKFEKKAA